MANSDFAVILDTSDIARAQLLEAILKGEGIPCMLENPRQGGWTGIFPVRLSVWKHDEQRAKQIIARHDAPHEEE